MNDAGDVTEQRQQDVQPEVEAEPHLYPGSYVEYVARTGHEAPGVHA